MSDSHKASLAPIERGALTDNMHPVVRTMLAQSPDPATLRELLAVQREWEAGEAKRAFTRALVEMKRDLPAVIGRDKTVDFGATHYTHTSLAAAMEAITGPLNRHGFSLSWHPSTGDKGVTVTCRLTHAGGHHEENTISAPADDKGSKSKAQGVASTITLLSRYTALALLGIATADMKDPAPGTVRDDPSEIDTARNMRAAASMRDYGKTRAQAEDFIGRKVPDWTIGDLDRLRAWVEQPSASEPADLGTVLAAIDSASSKAELAAIMPHLAKLEPKDKAKAIAKHKAKAEAIGVGNKSGKASSAEPPPDDDVPPVSAYDDVGGPPFDNSEAR